MGLKQLKLWRQFICIIFPIETDLEFRSIWIWVANYRINRANFPLIKCNTSIAIAPIYFFISFYYTFPPKKYFHPKNIIEIDTLQKTRWFCNGRIDRLIASLVLAILLRNPFMAAFGWKCHVLFGEFAMDIVANQSFLFLA